MASDGITFDVTDYATELLGNYEQLRVQRGLTHADMAEHLRGMGAEELAKQFDELGAENAKAARAKHAGRSEKATDSVTETR